MRNLIAGSLLALLLSSAALAAEKTETIKVSGWHCGGCAARTEAALKDVKGVTTVSSDKTKHVVKVTFGFSKEVLKDYLSRNQELRPGAGETEQ